MTGAEDGLGLFTRLKLQLRWVFVPFAADLTRYAAMPARRWQEAGHRHLPLPSVVRQALDLDVRSEGPLRVELGGGPFPTRGYVHVDTDRRAKHLEHRAPVWALPFEDGVVQEILAVHVLEHVHPGRLEATLTEWRRVLREGGSVRIHVPNGATIFTSFLSAEPPVKWALINGLFGMWASADVDAPSRLDPRRNAPDHKMVFDFELLEHELKAAGFQWVVDKTGVVPDRHDHEWRAVVSPYSLIVEAGL